MDIADVSRREFIARVSLAAASLSLTPRSLEAAANPGGIDVHHHFLPPGYADLAREYVAKTSPAMQSVFSVQWTPARSIEEMDRYGVAAAIVSISAPGVSFADADTALRLSRLVNDYGAGMKRDHPRRF